MFVVCFKTHIRKVLSKIRAKSPAKIKAINYCTYRHFEILRFVDEIFSLYSLTNVFF